VIVIGVDPGTGVKSPTGVFVFNEKTKQILLTAEVRSKSKDQYQIFADIAATVRAFAEQTKAKTLVVEKFAMRGASGEKLHKLIGAIGAQSVQLCQVLEAQNTSVKRIVGGHGASDKGQVALGVLTYFAENRNSALEIEELIKQESWDKLDAAAIGIAGLELQREKA
jgi:Holliday junction resolvasome RuvABC endonuclease subunit